MKKISFLGVFLTVVFITQVSVGQCFPDGIVIVSQAQIDNFASDHPGCSVIEGDVQIGYGWYNPNIENLDGLSPITSIGGQLSLWGLSSLVSLDGLANLKFIGKELEILGDSNLVHIGLPSLDSIGGILIESNKTMSLNGLASLSVINGDVKIIGNSLSSIDLFQNISSINGSVTIQSNPSLIELDMFNGLTALGGSLSIIDNVSMDNLDGLQNLDTIIGSLRIQNSGQTNLDSLKSLSMIGASLMLISDSELSDISILSSVDIQGGLILDNLPNLVSLNGLQSLDTLSGSLRITKLSGLTNLDSLKNITKIGGSLELTWNSALSSISGLKSASVIDAVRLESLPSLLSLDGLQKIENLTGDLILKAAPSLLNLQGLDSLKSVNNVYIENNDGLTSLEGLAGLVSIVNQFTLNNNSSLTSLSGLQSLANVGSMKLAKVPLGSLLGISSMTVHDNLEIEDNSSLQNLDGLSFVPIIKNVSIKDNDSLVDISAMSSISEVQMKISFVGNNSLPNFYGLQNIKKSTNLEVIDNKSLNSFYGFDNLESLYALSITDNSNLKSLDGLDKLTKVDDIEIKNNIKLTSIKGIRSIDANTMYAAYDPPFTDGIELELVGNKSLSDCSIEFLCDLINGSKQAIISNNGTYCSSKSSISCTDFGISGFCYFDANNNQLFDADETGIPNMNIVVGPSLFSSLTSEKGKYYYGSDSGNVYSFTWDENPDWQLTTDTMSYTILYEPGNSNNFNNNFGFYPTVTQHLADLSLMSGPTRCNTDVMFYLNLYNAGTFIESGKVILNYDPSCSFVQTNQNVMIDTFSHTIEFQYSDLFPFKSRDIELAFSLPDENSTGSPLNFSAFAFRDSVGTDVEMDYVSYHPIVQCSFDPNDKIVMPPGVQEENYTLHDQQLTYTIRFQNTGNAEAIDVKILDTIDADLDISTLRVVNSSFPVQTSIKDQAVVFLFKNIWLADSTHDEASSHGYLTYEIYPTSGLSDYTKIENTAHIIFDFNDAIVTNTTNNTMVAAIPVGVVGLEEVDVFIYPNPAKDFLYVSSSNAQPVDKVLIYNVLGDLVFATVEERARHEFYNIDISQLAKGVYFVKAKVGIKVGIKKLVID